MHAFNNLSISANESYAQAKYCTKLIRIHIRYNMLFLFRAFIMENQNYYQPFERVLMNQAQQPQPAATYVNPSSTNHQLSNHTWINHKQPALYEFAILYATTIAVLLINKRCFIHQNNRTRAGLSKATTGQGQFSVLFLLNLKHQIA